MDLLSVFNQSNTLRILEAYGMAIHRLQHEKILAAAQRDPSVLHTLETGPETSAYVCASCQAP